MKKSLVAMAILAAAGAASAQSSVTLFGVVDATLAYGSGSTSNKTQLTNSGYNSSRLGFRGVEDLGGGMSAGFWLEAGMNNDNGSGANTSTNNQSTGATGGGGLTFNRRSTVSLMSGMGELRLGRDYSPQFWNLTMFDPFGTNGVGTTQILNSSLGGPTQVRASNSIGYFLPKDLGGIYGQVQYYLGENNSNAANSNDGRGGAIRLGYANGPIDVAFATSRTTYLATPATGNVSTTNIGASYDFGVAKAMAAYSRDRVDTTTGITGKGLMIGALAPLGAGVLRASYSVYETNAAGTPKTNKLALGYVYNLSKRTAAYTTIARTSNKGGASQALNGSITKGNDSSTGFDLGIKHSF